MISIFDLTISLESIVIYLLFIFIPGALLYLRYFVNDQKRAYEFAFFLFFSNIFGYAIYISLSWVLLLLGIFYYWLLTIIMVLYIITLLFLPRKYGLWKEPLNIRKLIAKYIQSIPRPDRQDLILLLAITLSTIFIFLPVYIDLSTGSLVAGDTATFSQISNLVAIYHKWPNLLVLIHKYYTTSSSPPGISLLYTLLSMPTGTNAAYSTYPIDTLLTWFSMLGIFILCYRIVKDKMLSILFSVFWMFGMFVFISSSILNLTVIIAPSGTTPDLLLAEVLYFLFLVIAFENIDKKQGTLGAVIIAIIFVSMAISNPLVFIMVLFPYIFLLSTFFFKKSKLNYIKYLLIPAVSVYSTLVPYLTNFGGLIGLRISGKTLNDFSIGLILSGALAGLTLTLYIISFIRNRYNKTGKKVSKDSLYYVMIASCSVLFLILYFGGFSKRLLGISDWQLAIINSMFVVLIIAIIYSYLIGKFKNWKFKSFTVKSMTAVILTILIVGGMGYYITNNQTESIHTTKIAFNQNELTAANWINENVKDNGTMLLDGNDGNVYSLVSFRDFLHIPNVAIDQYTLNDSINYNNYPYNLPYIFGAIMISWPNYTNSLNAFREIGYRYYVFQTPYNEKDISVYQKLSYMNLIYNNSEIYLFEFNPNAKVSSFLINPISFSNSSPNACPLYWITHDFYGGPLRQVLSVYTGDTVVTAKMSPRNHNATFIQYTVNISESGCYDLYIHSYVYHPINQSITLYFNNALMGSVAYNSAGWNFSVPIKVDITTQTNTLYLVLSSNISETVYFNPIDYLLLVGT